MVLTNSFILMANQLKTLLADFIVKILCEHESMLNQFPRTKLTISWCVVCLATINMIQAPESAIEMLSNQLF